VRADHQKGGLFAVTLGPTLPFKASPLTSRTLVLGLLIVPPRPEGDGYVEVAAAGYGRIELEFSPLSSGVFGNACELQMGPLAAWPTASHLGGFDSEGRVVCYGRLIAMDAGRGGGDFLKFAPGAIKLKRC
jgi:hypothetical protein